MTRSVIRFCNGLITFLVTIVLIVCTAYAGYALWDNQQVHDAVENVMGELRDIRTQMDNDRAAQVPADESLFSQMEAINPDITAWITMPGTAIDYPVLQGKNNLTYINTDVYGEFAMAGSIYLDSRNNREYSDIYSLLYGHNMSKHRMFSDVNLYKEEAFFQENPQGKLMLEDGEHQLRLLSCILTSAGNSGIFNPENWKDSTNKQRLSMILEDAVQTDQETLEILKNRMEAEEPYRIVALSTCSGEFTDARTILLTLMDPE